MIVSDIYEEAREVLGYAEQALVISRISDAAECLNNEASLNANLEYYVTSPIPNPDGTPGNLLVMPREVKVPLKINIDDQPSLARDRLYEFSQNGPGSNSEKVDWQWEDRGNRPTFYPTDPEAALPFRIVSNAADAGKIMKFEVETVGDIFRTFSMTLGTDVDAPMKFIRIVRIHKPVTVNEVQLVDSNGGFLALFFPDETEPSYRTIRISKAGAVAYTLFRRAHIKLTALTDFVNIKSKMGLLLMIKSLEALRREQFDTAKNLGEQAVDKAKKEQGADNDFAELASATEMPGIQNLSYNNADSIIAADLYDEFCKILGPVGKKKVFDFMTECRQILGRKFQWDSLRGYVDINTDQYNYLTFPRYVEVPIRISINNQPTQIRNKWFQFTMDAPGRGCGCLRGHEWKDVGEVVTLRDVPYSVRLNAIPDSQADDGKFITVEGYTRNKWQQHTDANGKLVDGILVQMDSHGLIKSDVLIDRITRTTKPETAGFVQLIGVDSTQASPPVMIGYYFPDETEPKYRRVQLSRTCTQVRVMYRLRENKIKSFTDPIHLRSKSAMLCMARSLKLLADGKTKEANDMEMKATQYLLEEQAVTNQNEGLTIESDPSFSLRQFLPS